MPNFSPSNSRHSVTLFPGVIQQEDMSLIVYDDDSDTKPGSRQLFYVARRAFIMIES
jgi:hypothetical protein